MTRYKITVLLLCIASALMINRFSVEASAEKKLGLLLWTEEARYTESRNGVLDQMRKDGFQEPAVKFTMVNAGGSKAKLAKLVNDFAAAEMDMIIVFGTTAAIAVTKRITNVPVVFSTVYDPVETGISRGWKSSGNNTTGASTKIPMSKMVNILKEFAPIKRLAVLYTPGEKNAEAQLIELQKIQADSRIKVIPIILTRKEEVAEILSRIIPAADALYLTGSSIIGETVPIIADMANRAKVVTITHLDDLVDKGALLGVCVNSYLVGRLAGTKAVQVLKGARPSSIPVETEKKLDIILNMKTAKQGRFQIPSDFLNKVTKTIE